MLNSMERKLFKQNETEIIINFTIPPKRIKVFSNLLDLWARITNYKLVLQNLWSFHDKTFKFSQKKVFFKICSTKNSQNYFFFADLLLISFWKAKEVTAVKRRKVKKFLFKYFLKCCRVYAKVSLKHIFAHEQCSAEYLTN